MIGPRSEGRGGLAPCGSQGLKNGMQRSSAAEALRKESDSGAKDAVAKADCGSQGSEWVGVVVQWEGPWENFGRMWRRAHCGSQRSKGYVRSSAAEALGGIGPGRRTLALRSSPLSRIKDCMYVVQRQRLWEDPTRSEGRGRLRSIAALKDQELIRYVVQRQRPWKDSATCCSLPPRRSQGSSLDRTSFTAEALGDIRTRSEGRSACAPCGSQGSRDGHVRSSAAEALGGSDQERKDAVPAAHPAGSHKDQEWVVRESSGRALGRSGPERGPPALIAGSHTKVTRDVGSSAGRGFRRNRTRS